MKSFQELREKTLTPAEKKKREEIAKAIERDDPGMDMSKKMAIATAQAKKVAEGKGYPVGWMLKADPKLGAKVKATQDKQKAMHKVMGNPDAGKKKESVGEQKVPKGHHKMPDGTIMKDSEHQKEVSDTTLKNYNKGAMRDTMMGKKDRNAGMQQATKRLAGLSKPLMREETAVEAQYKMVGGKKMRWDDFKKMWTPVKDLFHTEQDKKETPPFEGPYKKVKSVIPGKQGEGPSTAKHLAKLGLKAFLKAKK